LLHLFTVEPACTGYLHANEVDSQFEGIAATLALDLEGAPTEQFTTNGPAVLP
jgi:hypothetical protein